MTDFSKYKKNATLADIGNSSLAETGFLQSVENTLKINSGRDTVLLQTDTTAKKPTLLEIRNWKWQQDKKMFITDSRYIPLKNDFDLGFKEVTEHKGLELPIHNLNRYNTDWLTIILLLALVLLATVRFGFVKYISSLFQSIVNYSTSNRLFREKNNSILHGAFRLDLMYYIVFSLFVLQVLSFLSIKTPNFGFIIYSKTLGLVILYFVLKKFVYKFVGTVFNGDPETSEFIFNIDNFNRVTGIILFPIVVLLAFYPYEYVVFIVVTGGIAVGGLYLFLLQRGISILLKKQFSIFYLFLYLCTLEFLPLLLIFKVVAE